MYEDYEPTSFSLAFRGAIAIAGILAILFLLFLLVFKLREKKFDSSLPGILKLVWLIISIVIIIYLFALFFPELTIDEWNRKFLDHLPFKRGILGVIFSTLAAFFISVFCIGGVVTYFEKPKNK